MSAWKFRRVARPSIAPRSSRCCSARRRRLQAAAGDFQGQPRRKLLVGRQGLGRFVQLQVRRPAHNQTANFCMKALAVNVKGTK